jgi:hypothetical protein
MPATEAQILANRKNAQLSSGPKTAEGKLASRGNAVTHGLTATTVMPQREAAEVERRTEAFVQELRPSGEVGVALARHAARMSVRMERCAEHENATMVERVRQALDEFTPPEGVEDPAVIARLRGEVERRALFDASKEATLARKYEVAAERGFFRALKELRLLERQRKAAESAELEETLGSILPGEMNDDEFDRLCEEAGMPRPTAADFGLPTGDRGASKGRFEVPVAIGRRC